MVAHDGTAGGGECFIDGLDEGMSVNNAYTIPDVSTDLIIGGALWTTGRDFKGLLSDVRVYNRKLTLQEARDQFLHPLALYQPRRIPWRAAAEEVATLSIAVTPADASYWIRGVKVVG